MAAKMQSNSCPLLKQKGHRCDAMMHVYLLQQQALQQQTAKSQSSTFTAIESDGKCPVECLMASSSQQLRAASTLTLSPLLVAITTQPVSRLSFVNVGRSSHTDRGPPAFELPA
jgi:hypothetical protein